MRDHEVIEFFGVDFILKQPHSFTVIKTFFPFHFPRSFTIQQKPSDSDSFYVEMFSNKNVHIKYMNGVCVCVYVSALKDFCRKKQNI